MLSKMVRSGKHALLGHLSELEGILQTKGTKFICSDDVTLADIGWAPIFDGMEFAGWWDTLYPISYPYVTRYWRRLKALPAYKSATKLLVVEDEYIMGVKFIVSRWKEQYDWFNALYE